MRQTLKRSVSMLLAAIMVISSFVAIPFTVSAGNDYTINSTTSTDGYYNLISKKDWDIAPGITESEIVLNNDAGTKRQVLFVMEADMNNEYVKVTHSYTGMLPEYGSYTTGVMSEQAAWAEANGYGNVVGAMNTCLSWYTGYPADRVGEPLGFIMYDSEIYFDPGNCGYTYGNVGFPSVVVINKDVDENGNPRPADIPKVEMPQIRSSADLDGWEQYVIPCSSGYIVKDGVNQYKTADHSSSSEAPRSVVGIKPDGTVVIMLNDGRQSPYSAGMSMYELAEVMLDLGCSFAVNCDGGGSSTFLSQRPGEELKVNNSPSDGSERPTTSGILFISTAPANGEFYKAHVSADDEYYTPNSAVQFNAIGTDMGGSVVDIPADAVWQLADDSFGTIDDKGIFTSNGKEGEVCVQLVYDGEVVGEATITIVLPDIAFKNDTIVIGYGDTMLLPVEVTTNEGRNPVTYKPGDIVYTLSDDNLGTIVGDEFIACDESTGLENGTLTAVICGQTEKTVTANIRFGKASDIVYDFEDGEFPVDTSNTGNIGGDDAPDTGEYIYGWHINDTRANGYFSYRYYAKKNYTPVGMDIPASVYLVDGDSGMVRNGNYAMGVHIDWTNVTASCHGQMDIALPESLDLTDATSFGFWMYLPEEMVTASMQVSAGFGSGRVDYKLTDVLAKNTGVNDGGWYYFSWDVLPNYKTVEYIQINSHYTAGEGNYNYYQDITYYIDDITVDYSEATIDRENPYFTSMTIADEYTNGVEVSGQTITTNTINLMAQAYENTTKVNATGLNRNSVKLYVDGVESNAAIATALNGTVSVSNLYLNDGVHTLVMEISDNQGNVGRIVRKLVVNTEKSAVRLEVPASEVNLPTGSVYWLNLVADDLSSIESVTTTINLDYVNDWELEGMEVAYGFEAEYYINTHNDAVITFTRTGTEIADTTVLAKLPVRIWMAKGWMDDSGVRADYISDDPKMQDKYYILTPHAMWYSDGTRDYRLVVGAEAGVVTYTDGTTETFSANETVIQTEMNRYYTNSGRQNKWSFHICTPGEAQSKAPTCTENGYENRVFCAGCACGSVKNLGSECDTHNGCGSVIDWGTIVPATGHDYKVVGNQLVCDCGEKFSANGFVEINGNTMYFIGENFLVGMNRIDSKYYNFDKNGAAYDGIINICGTDCLFDKGLSVETDTVLLAGSCGENAEYVIHKDGRMIVGGSGAITEYTTIGLVPWNAYHRYDIKSLFIGKDITSVGERAFRGLVNLESVTFEEGSKLEALHRISFSYCSSLKEVILPDSLTTIKGGVFLNCSSLNYVYVPTGAESIASDAFTGCAESLTLSVAENSAAHRLAISKGYNCTVRVIEIASGDCGDTKWSLTSDGVLTISGSGAMADYDAGKAPWYSYAKKINKIVIAKDVTRIGKFNFKDLKAVTEVVFEEGTKLESIGHGAFGTCTSLKTVTIPASVKTLDKYAFYYCSGLETVAFGEGSELTSIGGQAFWNCPNIKDFFVPDKVISIGTNAFLGCIETATFNVADGTYGHDFFKNYSIVVRDPILYTIAEGTCGDTEWVLISNGTLTISGSGAMADNEASKAPWQSYAKLIKKIVITKDVTYIGKFNFKDLKAVTEVVFEEGTKLETIGWGAFGFCTSLKSVTIPATVKTIDKYAFYYCSGLETVAFAAGSELASIGGQAFWNCPNIKNFFVPDKVITIGTNAFLGCIGTATFNVAEGTYGHDYFKNYNIVVRDPILYTIAEGTCGDTEWALVSNGTLTISGSGAMADNEASQAPWQSYAKLIKKIVITKDVTYIGKFNFKDLKAVTEVVFEEGTKLETIGHGAFGFCTSLKSVTVPATVKTIDKYAFYYCSGLETVAFGEGSQLRNINACAFFNDAALVSVAYPAGTVVASNAFAGCTNYKK